MSKSRLDKGSTLGNGRWDEEEHPRDDKGRFASSGTEGRDFTRDKHGKKVSVGDTILAHDGSVGKVIKINDGDVVAEDTKTHERWQWFSREFRVSKWSKF